MNEYSGFNQQVATSLISNAQMGDKKAMKSIYQTFAQSCFSLAMRMSGDRSAAQDIVHNTFVKVLSSIQHYNFSGAFAGWLRQIAVNESLTYLRRHCALEANLISTEDAMVNENTSYDESENENAYFSQQWWETCSDLSVLTERLSVDAKAVLYLHELEGYSHKEIASLLSRTESFSKQVLARTFKKLRDMHATNTDAKLIHTLEKDHEI